MDFPYVKPMFGEGSAIWVLRQGSEREVAQIAKKVGAKAILNPQSLIDALESGGSFPSRNREVCWRHVLQLPMNETQYLTYARQALHPVARKLPEKLPIRFSVVSTRLVRLISALSYWHPPLAECDWLPALAFPFLQAIGRDSLVVFEILATIINNFCQEWLYFVPNPPITTLSRIERIAKRFGGEAPLNVAWPALRSFFGEVATTEACLVLIDHILSSKIVFIEYLVASFCMLKNKRVDQLNVKRLIQRAKKMMKADEGENPNHAVFKPLDKGFYPVLPIIEKAANWKVKELQRIREEAELAKNQMALEHDIEIAETKLMRRRRGWLAEREILKEIENEQMLEFRRREKETLLRDARREEKFVARREEGIVTRKAQEEQAIQEWKNDCERLQDEMKDIARARQHTWETWLHVREEAARVGREEAENELYLLKVRGDTQNEEVTKHLEIMKDAELREQALLRHAITRSQEMEDEKCQNREKVETTRRNQAEEFLRRQVKMDS